MSCLPQANELLLQYTSKPKVFIENKQAAALGVYGDRDHSTMEPLPNIQFFTLTGIMYRRVCAEANQTQVC